MRWKGHEPQAFMLVFAKQIHEHGIETSDGSIDIATRVRHPETREAPIGGPNLALVAIGNHPDVRGFTAQRAWAQPVHNGHRFIPVDSNFDRAIVGALIAARRILALDNIVLSASKPLFDRMTPSGAVRPAWMVEVKHADRTIELVLDSDDSARIDRKRYEALAFCGPVIAIGTDNIHELAISLRGQMQHAKEHPRSR